MAAPRREDSLPRCPIPGHENSRVVLGGRYGKPGRQRQLYVCDQPKPGSTARSHRFAPPVQRASPPEPTVADDDRLDDLRVARNYQFIAQDIAAGLVAVSRGVSYTEAGREVRERAARRWPSAPARSVRRHGTLVSDWVEVYAEVLWAAQVRDRGRWPDEVLLAVLPLTTAGGVALAFSIFLAATYRPDGQLQVIAIRSGTGTGARDWGWFLREVARDRKGRPALIVGDGSSGLARAVAQVWPRRATRPAVWVDEHRMRAEAQEICRSHGLNRREDRLWRALLRAWRSPDDWRDFEIEARRYRLPDLDRWLERARAVMAVQFPMRTRSARRSRAGVEAVLTDLERWIGPRRTTFGNRARTDRLLLLMALNASGQARENAWTQLICAWLEHGNGRPASVQRALVDRTGRRSLRAGTTAD